MATIEKRGAYQFRAKIRIRGVAETRTFETHKAAEDWARRLEGKIVGEEYEDTRAAKNTPLSVALDWFADQIAPKDANGKRRPKSDWYNVQLSHIRYWQASEFANWSIMSLHSWDLVEWRRAVLDEDNAAGMDTEGAKDQFVGPERQCSRQTAIHRLNLLSKLYVTWPRAHRVTIANPVGRDVRPSKPDGRDRRLYPNEERRLLEAVEASTRPWLLPATILAIETCMRQAELAGLTWGRVRHEAKHPHVYLPKTKNGMQRTVPLSTRAVAAFRMLLPDGAACVGERRVFPFETSRAIIHAFRDAVKEEDFPDLRWHDLRHEAISRLFENTDLRDTEIMAITGHISQEMLIRYTHLRTAQRASRLDERRALHLHSPQFQQRPPVPRI